MRKLVMDTGDLWDVTPGGIDKELKCYADKNRKCGDNCIRFNIDDGDVFCGDFQIGEIEPVRENRP